MPVTSSIIAGSAGLIQGGIGVGQMIQANRYRKSQTRPTYQTPEAFEEALKNARAMAAQTRLPGQDYIEQQLGASTAAGVKSASEFGQTPSQILNTTANIYGNQMQQQNQLGLNAAQFRQQQLMNLQGMLGQKAAYQEKEWDINNMQPYEAAMHAAAQLSGAGQQNIGGGLTAIGAAGMNYAAYGHNPYKQPTQQIDMTDSQNPFDYHTYQQMGMTDYQNPNMYGQV